MKTLILFLAALLCGSTIAHVTPLKFPIGQPGSVLIYIHPAQAELPASVVRQIELRLGETEVVDDTPCQWLRLEAVKENGGSFKVWILAASYPDAALTASEKLIKRYIFQPLDSESFEYKHYLSGESVLPTTGAWRWLFPRDENKINPYENASKIVGFLGHDYYLTERKDEALILPGNIHEIQLSPDLLIGVPHNTRQKDETRLYDESDYELIPLVEQDYAEMIGAGLTCFRVDAQQVKWIENQNVYYWGIGGKEVVYPECLYRSNYLGPALFFDEPMVRTRDYVVRPKLKKDPELRKNLTPQMVLEDFKKLYHETKYEEGPASLIKGLNAREDVDTGKMNFLQENMYTWETMVSSSLYQLSEGQPLPPNAVVFEPPGRFGARRVLPELNMCFDCQIPVDHTKNLAGMIYSFLRGAARLTGKEWGTSIYGAVDRRDSFWMLTHAYDLGATRFFYWDSYQLACVPYSEYLAMSSHLRAHAGNNPERNLKKLKEAAEVAILIPPGYNLGHVYMGRGSLWAIPELHPERKNKYGVKYRKIMSNFYTEVERCLRLGIEFDSFWHLGDLSLEGYREIVDIREDGKVVITSGDKSLILENARVPERPGGRAPDLSVEVSTIKQADSYIIAATALVSEGSAPVFYTQGTDKNGHYNNIYVLWELFGPNEEDYYYPWTESWRIDVEKKDTQAQVSIRLPIEKPGIYRLRAATSDLAGRSTVVWKEVAVGL